MDGNIDFDELDRQAEALGVKLPKVPKILPSKNPFDDLIVDAGTRHGVDPDLLRAMTKQESSFNPRAVSSKKAQGLMQLIPATAQRFGVSDPFDPKQNIEGGTKYMRWLLDRYDGDVDKALAGYNAGEGAVDKYKGIPPYRETQDYVRKIRSNYRGGGLMDKGPDFDALDKQFSALTGQTDFDALDKQFASLGGTQNVAPQTVAPQVVTPGIGNTPQDVVDANREYLSKPVAPSLPKPDLAQEAQDLNIVTGKESGELYKTDWGQEYGAMPKSVKLADGRVLTQKDKQLYADEKGSTYKFDGEKVRQLTEAPEKPIATDEDFKAWAAFKKVAPTPENRKVFEQDLAAADKENVGKDVTSGYRTGDNLRPVVQGQTVPAEQAVAPNVTQSGQVPYQELPNDSSKVGVVKTDDDLLKTQAGKVAVDLSQKPKGMGGAEYLRRSYLKALQPRFGYSDAQIDAWIAKNKGKLTDDDEYWNKVDNTYKTDKGNGLITVRGQRDMIAEVMGDREAVKQDYQRAQEEAALLNVQDPLSVGDSTDDLQRSFETDDRRQEIFKQRDLENQGIDTDLYRQAEEYVRNSPFSKGTQADIEEEYRNLKNSSVSPETTAALKELGRGVRESQSGTAEIGASALGALAETVGDYGAGLMRLFGGYGLLGDTDGNIYSKLRSLGNGARIFKTAAKRDDLLGEATSLVGSGLVEVPKFVALSALPGGAIVGFGVDAGLRSAGQGKNPLEIGKETAKGLLLGGIFKGASKLEGLAEKGFLSTFKQGVNPSPDVALASKVFGAGARIGTIGVGTYNLERGFGATDEEAFYSAVMMALTDLAFQGQKFGEIKDLTGKVFRMRNSKTGETADVTVENGEVKLLKGEVPKEAVDAEFDLANVKDVAPDADGVYRVKGDAEPVRTETRLLKGGAERRNPESIVKDLDEQNVSATFEALTDEGYSPKEAGDLIETELQSRKSSAETENISGKSIAKSEKDIPPTNNETKAEQIAPSVEVAPEVSKSEAKAPETKVADKPISDELNKVESAQKGEIVTGDRVDTGLQKGRVTGVTEKGNFTIRYDDGHTANVEPSQLTKLENRTESKSDFEAMARKYDDATEFSSAVVANDSLLDRSQELGLNDLIKVWEGATGKTFEKKVVDRWAKPESAKTGEVEKVGESQKQPIIAKELKELSRNIERKIHSYESNKDNSKRGILGGSVIKPSENEIALSEAIQKHIYEGNTAMDLMSKDFNLTVGKGKNQRKVYSLEDFQKANPKYKDITEPEWQKLFQPYMDEAGKRIENLWQNPPREVLDAYAKLKPLSPTQRAELRRQKDVSAEELKAKGVKPLGEKGQYGQTSYAIHRAMEGENSVLSDLAKTFAPEVDTADKNAGNAVLDAIAEVAGKSRSSQISPSDWNKLLSAHADRMTDESIDAILGALAHQEDWYKRAKEFATGERMTEILKNADLSASEFKNLDLRTRKEILKLGREFNLSDESIKQVFNKTLSEFAAQESGVGTGEAEKGSLEAQGEKEKGYVEDRRLPARTPRKQARVKINVAPILAKPRISRTEAMELAKAQVLEAAETADSDFRLPMQTRIEHNGQIFNFDTRTVAKEVKVKPVRERMNYYQPVKKATEILDSKAIGKDTDLQSLSPVDLYGMAQAEPYKITKAGIQITPAQAEILRRVESIADVESGRKKASGRSRLAFDGQHLYKGSVKEIRGILLRAADNYPQQTKLWLQKFALDLTRIVNRDGTLVIYTTSDPSVKYHEQSHQASALGANEALLSERVDMDEGANRPEYAVARPFLLKRGYEDEPARLLEEIFAHIQQGKFESIGLDEKGAFNFLKWWYNSYNEQGHNIFHPKFDESTELFGKGVLENAREQSATRKNPENAGTEGTGVSRGLRSVEERRRSLNEIRSFPEGTGALERPGRRELAEKQRDTDLENSILDSLKSGEEPQTPLAKKLFSQIYEKRGDEFTPKKEVVVNFRRAGLLTSPKTHLRNVLSNTAFQASEEAMRPVALLADLAASAVTGKRTVQAPSIPGVLKSFRALVMQDKTMSALNQESGIKRAWGILKTGDTQELAKNQLAEMRSGSPLLDKFVNYTFRALGAEDALFKVYAFRRSLEEQAKTMAVTKARSISIWKPGEKLRYIRAQKLAMLEKPSKEMILEASLFADFATFTNANPVSDWFRKVKDLDQTGKAVLEILVPYDKTPTNIILRTLEYSPVGFGMSAKHLIDWKRGKSYALDNVRRQYEEGWAEMDKGREGVKGMLAERTLNLLEGSNKIKEELDRLENGKLTEAQEAHLEKLRDEQKKLAAIEERTPAQSRRLLKIQELIDRYTAPQPMTEKRYHRINELRKTLARQQGKIDAYQKIKQRRKVKDKFREEDRKEIEQAIDRLFPRIQQQQFAKSFGRAGFGSAALALGMVLAMRGLLSGVWDAGESDEKKEHYKRQDEGILDGSLLLGNRRYQIGDTPLGKTMVTGASIWERSQQKLKKDQTRTGKFITDTADVSGSLVTQQPLLDAYFNGKDNKSIDGRIGDLLGSFVPSILADVADVSDDEKRETKGLLDAGANRIPVLREELPIAEHDRETYLQDMTNRAINKFDPFNSRPVMDKEAKRQQKIQILEKKLKSAKTEKQKEILQQMLDGLKKSEKQEFADTPVNIGLIPDPVDIDLVPTRYNNFKNARRSENVIDLRYNNPLFQIIEASKEGDAETMKENLKKIKVGELSAAEKAEIRKAWRRVRN